MEMLLGGGLPTEPENEADEVPDTTDETIGDTVVTDGITCDVDTVIIE